MYVVSLHTESTDSVIIYGPPGPYIWASGNETNMDPSCTDPPWAGSRTVRISLADLFVREGTLEVAFPDFSYVIMSWLILYSGQRSYDPIYDPRS